MGQNRAKVSHEQLSTLNSKAEVKFNTSKLTENFLATFKVRQSYVSRAMEVRNMGEEAILVMLERSDES